MKQIGPIQSKHPSLFAISAPLFPPFKPNGFASSDPHSLLESGRDHSLPGPRLHIQTLLLEQLESVGPEMIALFSHFILPVSVFFLNSLETQ